MPPSDPITIGREKKIAATIDFAKDLLSKLRTSSDSISIETLLADLNHHIHSLTAPTQKQTTLSAQLMKELKHYGRSLWNECIKERRRQDDAPMAKERSRLLVRTRIFAFQITALARETSRGRKRDKEGELVYLVNLALTVGRICVEDSDLDGSRLALQKVADYVERIKDTPTDDPELRIKLEAEYLTMRIALSWKEDRLDVAEHMYGKTEDLRKSIDIASAEHMADALQHIGSDLTSKGDHVMALKWLRRAYELINNQDLGRLSAEGLQLRLAICHDLIQALLGVGSQEYIQEADDLISYTESEIGDKPVVLHWRLEILMKSPAEAFDTEAYTSILRRMIRVVDFSEAVFTFLLHHIKELRERNYRMAIALIDELLLTRLIHSDNTDWIGKVFVRRVWMSTMETDPSQGATDLLGLLERVSGSSGPSLGPDIAGAIHSLIWKKIDAIYTKQQYTQTDLWCQVALHPIFSSSGQVNQGKFGRKRILCAIKNQDMNACLTTFNAMPEPVRDDSLTRYLMFKASLIGWDHELGRRSIEHLSRGTDQGRTQDMLYACIKEAQQAGDKLCTLAALKAVVESYDSGKSSKAHFPSILRCTIRLIHLIESQDNENGPENYDFMEDTCRIFETAMEHAKSDPRGEEGNTIFTVAELEWFRKNAYNIGVTKCHRIPSKDVTDMVLMAMRCHFVIAAALVSLARTEDKVEEQLQRYVEMRQHIAAFDHLRHSEAGLKDQEVLKDLENKLSTLFVFDFEAAIYLKAWDDLSTIVRRARSCKDELMYKAMGDCLLRSQASGKVIYGTMSLIINEIFTLEDFDAQRAAKYTRCMFQAILPLDESLAIQVVDQALQIAREGSQVQRPFPAEDLDWVVTTTFNHAIDILARGDQDLGHQWALKALDLAQYMNDGGDTRTILRERVAKLRLDGVPGG